MRMHLETVTRTDEFAALRLEWDGLLAESHQDCPFLSHQRLFTWWRLFGKGKDLSVIACRNGSGELVGVLPTYITQIGRTVTARAMRFLGDTDIGSTNLTAFARHGLEDDVAAALRDHLRRRPRAWDLLDFAYVDCDEPFLRLVRESPSVRVVPRCGSTQRIRLPKDWDGYRKTLSAKRRQALNSALNKSQRAGDEIELVTRAADLPEALADFWRLHELRMSSKFKTGFGVNPGYRAFVESMANQLLDDGRLRLVFLRREGRRVAVAYQFAYGDTVYGEKSGFEPAASSVDLLRPLIGSQIQWAIEAGYAVYDMMLGDEPYKRGWGVNEVQDFCHMRVYDASMSGRLRRGRDALAEALARIRPERETGAAAKLALW